MAAHSIERRFAPAQAAGRTVYGLAVPFNVEAQIGPAHREILSPGALDATLRDGRNGRDVRMLYGHDDNNLLARSGNGSLRLWTSDAGLHYEARLPQTTLGEDVRALLADGTLSHVSIGFEIVRERWEKDLRTIEAIDLWEISLVGNPAFLDTTAALRSKSKPEPADWQRELAKLRVRIAELR